MNKKILTSLAILAVTAAAVAGGTLALFHDSKTVAGNKIGAGKFVLSLDSQCHYDGMVCSENGVWVEESNGSSTYPELAGQPCSCTWSLTDKLAGKLFFDLDDVKPGDQGESTISFHVDNNPAWICAAFTNIKNHENCCTSSETSAPVPGDTTGVDATCDTYVCGEDSGDDDIADDDTAGTGLTGEGMGELQDSLLFSVWVDNGAGEHACNNIKDDDETYTATGVKAVDGVWPIVDSSVKDAKPVLDGCVGIEWSVAKNVGNIIQTDSIIGDITFTAYQSRNNLDFTCNGEEPETAKLTLNKIVSGGDEPATSWTVTATGPATLSAAGTVSGEVPAGAYALSETGDVEDYTNGTTWKCDGGTLVDSSLTLADGDSVTCEITNTYVEPEPKTGILKVVKVKGTGCSGLPGCDFNEFAFSIGGGTPVNFDNDGVVETVVPVGTFSVLETDKACDVSYGSQSFNPSYNNCANVAVAEGQTVTCTITNAEKCGRTAHPFHQPVCN